MSDKDFHDKSKVTDAGWRRENKVTIKTFIELVLDTFAPRDSEEREQLKTFGRSPKWDEIIDWADDLQWFSISSRERDSPRSSPHSPEGPPPPSPETFMPAQLPPAAPPAATFMPPPPTSIIPTRYGAVAPPEELYQEVWFDAHSREEKCLPPFSYLSHFLTVMLLGGGCKAFYSFLSGSGVTPAALEVFQKAVSESALTVKPAASLVSRTVSAACSVLASTGEFVFNIGDSLSRMSGPLLNLFYTVYPLAVLRRGKDVKGTVDSVLNDVENVFSRLTSLRHGVSAARDRRVIEYRVKLDVLKRNKVQLKNKLVSFVSALKGKVKTNYNKTQGNICQALMEIYGGKRRVARIDSVEKVNIMFERAFSFDVSSYADMVITSRHVARSIRPVPLSREQLYAPAVEASLRARNVNPKDEMEEDETAESFLTQFKDYDASGAKRRTRRHRKVKKGKRTRIHSGRKNIKGKTRRHKNMKRKSTRKGRR